MLIDISLITPVFNFYRILLRFNANNWNVLSNLSNQTKFKPTKFTEKIMINIFPCFRFMLKIGIILIKYIRHHSCNHISMQFVMIFFSILPFSRSRKFFLLHMCSRDCLRYARICTQYWKAGLRSWNTIKPVMQNANGGAEHSNSFKSHVNVSWIFSAVCLAYGKQPKFLENV